MIAGVRTVTGGGWEDEDYSSERLAISYDREDRGEISWVIEDPALHKYFVYFDWDGNGLADLVAKPYVVSERGVPMGNFGAIQTIGEQEAWITVGEFMWPDYVRQNRAREHGACRAVRLARVAWPAPGTGA
ncbi:MAG: hypothetical protein HN406_03520 [Lentisphaerae bacterium]|nr:hypothetical protein [Lentisphaerota bacterium]